MTHSLIRRAPALKPLAVAACLSLCAITAQADEQVLPEVTITGARFASDPALAPVGAIVISAAEIRNAGVADVNQAIRKIGGVYGRQGLDGSPEFALDLRGFGANSGQNMVLMVDGVRLSENDLGSTILSTIPIDTIERIEIVRGGASVLYGDGATGGVIQIITKRAASAELHGSLRAEAGQFGLADVRASLARAFGALALDAAFGRQRTDNYRAHSDFDQTTFSGGAVWRYSDLGRAGVRVDSARQDAQLAGSLTGEQFAADPRQASTPKDVGALRSDRVSAFVEQRVGAFDLAAELAHRRKVTESTYFFSDIGSLLRYTSEQDQFSPRLRHLAEMGGVLNELVAGVDLGRWDRITTTVFGSGSQVRQKSRAIYLRDELKFPAARNTRLAAGVRHERIDKEVHDALGFEQPGSRQSQNAWELQGSVDVAPKVNLFLKTGQSFRVPNADENGYRASLAVLKIQTSRDLELGAVLGDTTLGLSARVFRHALNDEIFYDPTIDGFGANTNLDPTERRGLELDGHAQLDNSVRLSAHLQHVNARFTAGPNDGRSMVLVPKNVATLRLSWLPGSGHSADVGVQWVDRQRDGGDFANSCTTPIAAYTTLDARYARQLGAWEFAVAGQNLANRQYTSNAFACNSAIYPSDGRQIKASVRYAF
ncbi:TonB-dependent receptor [Massilia sp. CF038]|uniref:TonB-dependent receptor family protein n=1 Tax=Massilia sp. CF038 TaxID=1881045 RepID=UPI00091FC6D6|nr:TonB-dependent receptor [Massilia sp. CF038]SHH15387.1 iron complex outermembrane recepter protein [Massilia sp. CF038]